MTLNYLKQTKYKRKQIKTMKNLKIENIKTQWAKIAEPDDRQSPPKYSIDLLPNKEQQQQLEEHLISVWEYKSDPGWFGGKKTLDDGQIKFTAKKTAVQERQGLEVPTPLKVYNRSAVLYPANEIPRIANGAIVNVSVRAFASEFQGKKGVSLTLNSIQLVEFEPWDEDGFEPLDSETKPTPDFDQLSDALDQTPISETQRNTLRQTAARNKWTVNTMKKVLTDFECKDLKQLKSYCYDDFYSIVSKEPDASGYHE